MHLDADHNAGTLRPWPPLPWPEGHIHLAESVVHARWVNTEVLTDRRQRETSFVQLHGVLHILRPQHVATVDDALAVENRCDGRAMNAEL
jgi:hypothetical protein